MIINHNTIKHAVLYQTLYDQVERLRRICNHSNINAISNHIVQIERKIIMLQYGFQTRFQRVQRRESEEQMLFRQLCETKVGQDRERASQIQNNRSLLTELRGQRQQLRNLQKNVQNFQQQRTQLENEIRRKREQINRTKLKKEDEYDQLNSQNITILSCKQQINQLQRSINAYESQYLYQQTLLNQSNKDIKTLKLQLGESRKVLSDKSKFTEKERNYYLKQTEILNQQWVSLIQEKENKSSEIQQIKKKITEINFDQENAAKSISFKEGEIKKFEDGIVKQMKATQEIQTLIFETKVSRSNLKTSNTQQSQKLFRLKTLKNNLINLLAQQ